MKKGNFIILSVLSILALFIWFNCSPSMGQHIQSSSNFNVLDNSDVARATAISSPQNLMVAPMAYDDTSISILWDKPSDYIANPPSSYNVYINGTLKINTPNISYTATGLSANTSYTFSVAAVGSDGTVSPAGSSITQSTTATPQVFNVTGYGAVGDGSTLNTTAIQNAINACSPGGKVLIPSGTFLSGSIFLKSNMTLEIDGTLQGSTSASDYTQMPMRFEGTEETCYSGLINVGNTRNHTYGGSIDHVTICGSGTVYGGGSSLASAEGGGSKRGRLIYMANASYVNLHGLKLTNTPCWTIHPLYSTQISIHDLDIETASITNGDGCDPDSSTYVYFFKDTFNTGDDCIAIKSGINSEGYSIGMASAYIRVTDCTFLQGHGSVTIGSESSGGVHDVFAQNITVNGNNIGLRMKTCAARGGTVENITVADWNVTGVTKAGISVVTNYSSTSGGSAAPSLPICRNIKVINYNVDSTSKMGFDIEGESDIHITNMTFQNANFNESKSTNKLYYVDSATFTNCTHAAAVDQQNCTSVTGL